jgi:hypothetical protein
MPRAQSRGLDCAQSSEVTAPVSNIWFAEQFMGKIGRLRVVKAAEGEPSTPPLTHRIDAFQ